MFLGIGVSMLMRKIQSRTSNQGSSMIWFSYVVCKVVRIRCVDVESCCAVVPGLYQSNNPCLVTGQRGSPSDACSWQCSKSTGPFKNHRVFLTLAKLRKHASFLPEPHRRVCVFFGTLLGALRHPCPTGLGHLPLSPSPPFHETFEVLHSPNFTSPLRLDT